MSSNKNSTTASIAGRWFTSLAVLLTLVTTGCQFDVGGQTLPSSYYLQDDIHYATPGSENKLINEHNALLKAKEEEKLEAADNN